jgi:hypothetical protein
MFIGVTHHATLGNIQDRSVENPEIFAPVCTDVPRIAMWLHGHWHQRQFYQATGHGGSSVVVSGAQSLTLSGGRRAENTLKGFSMIELSRRGGTIRGCEGWPIEWKTEKIESGRATSQKFKSNRAGYFFPEAAYDNGT